MSEWKPIESAPKDGEEIIVWSPEDGVCVVWFSRWDHFVLGPDDGWVVNWNYEFSAPDQTANPTHWMPLPSPPNKQE